MRSQSLDAADVSCRRAVEVACAQGARAFELRAAMSLARLSRVRGRPEDARAMLAPVYEWFTEGFETPDVQATKSLLGELA